MSGVRHISLGLFLFAFWLALSGHYTAMLVTAGACSAALCVYAAARMKIVDHEGHPVHLLVPAARYYPWLIVEILKSAWAVTKASLDPRLPISPTLTRVHASQKTPEGVATYANSITLTPGTITVGVKAHELTVHALVQDGARDLEAGGMDAKVKQFEARS